MAFTRNCGDCTTFHREHLGYDHARSMKHVLLSQPCDQDSLRGLETDIRATVAAPKKQFCRTIIDAMSQLRYTVTADSTQIVIRCITSQWYTLHWSMLDTDCNQTPLLKQSERLCIPRITRRHRCCVLVPSQRIDRHCNPAFASLSSPVCYCSLRLIKLLHAFYAASKLLRLAKPSNLGNITPMVDRLYSGDVEEPANNALS